MQINYFHTSEAVPPVLSPAEGGPDAAVVIDVLRATTTIAWSLQNGAEAVEAFADLTALETAAAAWPAERCLRAGERAVSASAVMTWATPPWRSRRSWWVANAFS